MMYYWHHFQPGQRFWSLETPGDNLFSTSSVAFALDIGRKSVSRIPVKPALEHKGQRFYRKRDLVAWLELDLANGDASLISALRLAHAAEIKKRGAKKHRERF